MYFSRVSNSNSKDNVRTGQSTWCVVPGLQNVLFINGWRELGELYTWGLSLKKKGRKDPTVSPSFLEIMFTERSVILSNLAILLAPFIQRTSIKHLLSSVPWDVLRSQGQCPTGLPARTLQVSRGERRKRLLTIQSNKYNKERWCCSTGLRGEHAPSVCTCATQRCRDRKRKKQVHP